MLVLVRIFPRGTQYFTRGGGAHPHPPSGWYITVIEDITCFIISFLIFPFCTRSANRKNCVKHFSIPVRVQSPWGWVRWCACETKYKKAFYTLSFLCGIWLIFVQEGPLFVTNTSHELAGR